MALLFAPHTVQVKAVSEPVNAQNEVGIPQEAAGVSVTGYLYPLRGRVIYDALAGAELVNPHAFDMELADADKFHYGYTLVHGTRAFQVRGEPDLYNAGGEFADLDHATVLLELRELAS